MELPLLPFQQKPRQWQLCLLQMLQEDSEAWTRTRMRNKSVAFREDLLASALLQKYCSSGFIKSLLTSRKQICCWAGMVRAAENFSIVLLLSWRQLCAPPCQVMQAVPQSDSSSCLPPKSTDHCRPEAHCCLLTAFSIQPIQCGQTGY